jgi:beta-galactosidase
MSEPVGLPDLLDIVGYNYQESRYAADHARVPNRVIFGSENSHRFADWTAVRDNEYVAGQFLWTGIDYLGEARVFPNRASSSGLLDLCGFRKPLAWFRQALWSGKPMVYLAASPATAAGASAGRPVPPQERWNWPDGTPLRVSCYTTCTDVSLTLNGKTIGTRKAAEAVDGVLTWEVPYAPGVLKAVGRVNGKPVAEFSLTTAGEPARVVLREVGLRREVREVEFEVQDTRGVRIPDAQTEATFVLDGPARILGIGNGNPNSLENGQAPVHKAFEGRGLVTLRLTGPADRVTLTASAPGLQPARLALDPGTRPAL